MLVHIIKRLSWWLLASALLPLLIPVFVLMIGDELVGNAGSGVLPVILKLIMEGFYVFSSLTLFFSLFEDYEAFVKSTHPALMLIMTIPIFIICVIFYKIDQEGITYMQQHTALFAWSWGLLIAYATFLKYKILRYIYKYNYGR